MTQRPNWLTALTNCATRPLEEPVGSADDVEEPKFPRKYIGLANQKLSSIVKIPVSTTPSASPQAPCYV